MVQVQFKKHKASRLHVDIELIESDAYQIITAQV